MNKTLKIMTVGCLIWGTTLPIYAETQSILSGTASTSALCQKMGIRGMPMALQITMPTTPNGMPKIDSTQGFSFEHPHLIQFNKEGVADHCDYYIYGNPITINGQMFFVQRMVIDSQFNGKACIHSTGELDIAPTSSSSNRDICIVPLTGND